VVPVPWSPSTKDDKIIKCLENQHRLECLLTCYGLLELRRLQDSHSALLPKAKSRLDLVDLTFLHIKTKT